MTFLAPEFLVGLLLVPLAVVGYLLLQRRRSRYAVRFTNLDLLANLAPKRPGVRRHVPPAFYLLAIGGLLLALARPVIVVATPREDATVLLAMDVSGSMNAIDVEPTRLAAAKAAATQFLEQLPEGLRVGIVSFSTAPVTLVEPTADRAAVRSAIDRLTAHGGTAMGDALMRALDLAEEVQAGNAVGPAPGASGDRPPGASGDPAASAAPDVSAAPEPSTAPDPSAVPDAADDGSLVAVILLSDGANSVGEAEPLDAAERAATLGVPIYTIALGTEDGRVQVRDDLGNLVTIDVPPDRATLASIAEITGGTSFDAPTAEDLEAVYANLRSRIGTVPEEQEITSALAAAALVAVVGGAGLAAFWFGRLP